MASYDFIMNESSRDPSINFDAILSEFHEKFQELTKVLNILRNSVRKILKMLEISGICEKIHFFE